MWVLYLFPGSSSGSIIFLSLVGGHSFKVWISAVVQKEDGEGEGHRLCDKRMCRESGVWRESEHFASPVCQSRSGSVPVWALCPRGGSVWPAQTSKREAEKVCLWGVSEAYWQERFSLHLHVKWPGCDTAAEWRKRRMTGDFLGSVMSPAFLPITALVCEQCSWNLQLNLYPVLTDERRTVDVIRRSFSHLIMHLIVAVNCFVYCFFMHCLSKYFPHGMQMLSFCFVCIYILFAFLHIIFLSLSLPPSLCTPLCILKIFGTPLSSSAWQTALI